MRKTHLTYLLAALMVLGPVARTAMAAPKDAPKDVSNDALKTAAPKTAPKAAAKAAQRPSVEEVKIKVARLGTGSKAKATVWTADGTKVKGYVAQADENDFVMRDRKTNAPTTIRYADVVKFDRNKGHSTAKWVTVGVLAGVGSFLIILFATIAHLD